MRIPVSRPKLSYANVVSTICLFLLLGGGAAFAATQQLAKNSVGARQLRRGAVTPAKISGATRTALVGATGPAGPQGPRGEIGAAGPAGPRGEAATKYLAQVRVDGTVNTSSAPVTVKNSATGIYLVNFGVDVTHCVAMVNQGAVPNFDTPGSNTGAAEGYGARADLTTGGAGKQFAPGYPAGETVAVATFEGESRQNSPFQIAVLC